MRGPLGGGLPNTLEVFVGERKVPEVLGVRLGLWSVQGVGVITGRNFQGKFVVFNREADRWQVVASAFHAIRQTWHIMFEYGQDMGFGEVNEMARAAKLARQLNLAVLGVGHGASVASLRMQTRGAVEELSDIMGNPRKLSKIEAQRQVQALGLMADSRGRPNPGTMRARAVALRERALERLEEEILRIEPKIFARQHVLIRLVQYAELILTGVRDFLSTAITVSGLAQFTNPALRRQLIEHCQYLAADLDRIDFCPYRRTCKEAAEDLREVARILTTTTMDSATLDQIRDLLANCSTAMAFKSIQLAVERLLYRLMRDVDRPRFAVMRFREDLGTLISRLVAIEESGLHCSPKHAVLLQLSEASGHAERGLWDAVKTSLKQASAEL